MNIRNIADRAALALRYVRLGDTVSRQRLISGIAEQTGRAWPHLDIFKQQGEEYTKSAWVFTAVSRIAESAALVPFGVYDVGELEGNDTSQDRGQRSAILLPNHPIEQLLRRPNPVMSGFELIESTFGFLELNGNAYWFLAGDRAPNEIWPLRPDRMQVVPDTENYIGGYIYRLDAHEIRLQPNEVIHFKRWHPANDFYGLSTLEAAALDSQPDRAQAAWNRNFFGRENAVPSGGFYIRGNVSDSDYDRIKREAIEQFSGTARRTMFLRGMADQIQWINMGISQRDMDFIKSRQFTKDAIFEVFGIPGGLFAKDATYAK